ncbi:MAG: helix-turn-helix domain-containing protein [Candidatus Limnocylindria bacterium]
MPTRTNPIHEAASQAEWSLRTIGRELRLARILAGKTQRQVGAAIGSSAATVCRVEQSRQPSVTVPYLMRHAAAIGMKLSLKAFPAGRRMLDAAQLDLLQKFNARLHPSWQRTMEAVVPIPGDLRAADELIRNANCSCAIEAIARLADHQAQARAGRLKARDLGADRLILLVSGSHANRRALHEVGPLADAGFPIGTRAAMRALEAGEDPGGDAIILI